MKKRLVILIAATLLITSMPFFAFAEDEAPAAGSSQANVVREVEGRLYYFDGSGEPDMTNGWKTASNGIYYVPSGQIVTSPVWIEGSKTLTKKTKLSKAMYATEAPVTSENGTVTVKLTGKKNFTGTAVVTVSK